MTLRSVLPLALVCALLAGGCGSGGGGSATRPDSTSPPSASGPAGGSCTFSDPGGIHPCPFPWQKNATVTGTSDGGFAVAWDTPDRQRPGNFVHARRFDAQGSPVDAPTRVDAAATPEAVPVARSVGEGFVIAWNGVDADDSGVFARDFRSGTLP